MFRAGLYARVSTNDQQTLADAEPPCGSMLPGGAGRLPCNVREVGSGAAKREAREKLLEAARRREIDVVLVWRLDRWGRSVTDLLATLQELEHLGVGFVSLTEALDLTTPAGRAMAGLLAVFAEFEREILRERTRAGLAHARQNGKRWAGPATAAACCRDPETTSRRRQQIRDRPPTPGRAYLGTPYSALIIPISYDANTAPGVKEEVRNLSNAVPLPGAAADDPDSVFFHALAIMHTPQYPARKLGCSPRRVAAYSDPWCSRTARLLRQTRSPPRRTS
jgi:putative DNA-invertase from lambdoid prophage Rac